MVRFVVTRLPVEIIIYYCQIEHVHEMGVYSMWLSDGHIIYIIITSLTSYLCAGFKINSDLCKILYLSEPKYSKSRAGSLDQPWTIDVHHRYRRHQYHDCKDENLTGVRLHNP